MLYFICLLWSCDCWCSVILINVCLLIQFNIQQSFPSHRCLELRMTSCFHIKSFFIYISVFMYTSCCCFSKKNRTCNQPQLITHSASARRNHETIQRFHRNSIIGIKHILEEIIESIFLLLTILATHSNFGGNV